MSSRTVVGAARTRPCTVIVCRGCCCGNSRKHPGTDHQWQLDRLRAAAAESGGRLVVRTTDCLGPCGQANVIVVQPSAEGRLGGGRATWIGWALDDDCTSDILRWAVDGGPGVTDPPATLELQFIAAPGEARARTRGRGRNRARR
ncbi:(2Fe-2S) ferredoxin domain-containing protein [Streptantibioticus rubrisoli]|uniref:(2Fe-2S) ferredoxin domain-containing protein n=1 Tax=Streptantibioticus rubrisoli TaxID=1387313 RepID=A0ABT1P9J4_9ACTN|nr:(2Fe-2S) ferredoxin domain-containing protein [Streptantibioticus rubrisoli]MCQ4042005.1 (2Fe-2S) ferredoxin domain-containing protein [Streptantibioticus rubrisoli]